MELQGQNPPFFPSTWATRVEASNLQAKYRETA